MKISVVMPSFNQSRYVEAALKSVVSQNYHDLEILFIDGGSTDGTMDIVDKFRRYLTYCVSEADGGQSDALRKGFSLASGDVLTWLNTDDVLLPGALNEVKALFSERRSADVVFGNTVWIDAHDRVLKCFKSGEVFSVRWGPRMGLFTAGGPSAFFTRRVYDAVGGVNPDLHYLMDTELWWRFAMHGAEMKRSNRYIWALRLHSDAKVSGHLFAPPGDPNQRRISMEQDAERRHLRALMANYVWPIPSPLRKAVRAVRRATAPAYYQSLWHTSVWQSKELEAAVGSICPRV